MDDYGALIKSGQSLVPDYATQEAQRQLMALRGDELQLQMQKAAQQIAGDQAYKADMTGYLANPTPEGAARLIALHPDRAEPIKNSFDMMEKSKKAADLQGISEMYSAAKVGKFDLAAKLARRRVEADKAAGFDTTMDEHVLSGLESANPAEQRAALGMLELSLQVITDGKLGGKEKGGYTLEAGAVRYDENNQPIAQSPYIKTADGGILIAEGGGQASGQGGPAPTTPARTDPKTVWERMVGPDGKGGIEGGTNPDGSFRTSPAGAVGPAQVMPGTAPEAAKLAGVAYDEQRYRSDPAYNLALGKAYYAKQLSDFGDPVLAAAAYNAGPGRVRQAIQKGGPDGWVEHLPAETRNYVKVVSGGDPTVSNAGATAGTPPAPPGYRWLTPPKGREAPSGMRWTAEGNLEKIPVAGEDKPRRMTPAEVAAEGLNPNVVYYRNKEGVPTAVSGQDTRTTAARPIPQTVENKAKPLIDARDSFSRLNSTWKDDFGGYTVTGGASNWLQGKLGTGPKGQREWWADFKSMDNLIRNDLFGSALTATEKAAYEATTIDPSMAPSQIKQNLQRRARIVNQAVARTKNYLIKNRFDPEAVDALFAPLGGETASAAPVRVRSVQEAKRLAPGTEFITPDGRRMRKR